MSVTKKNIIQNIKRESSTSTEDSVTFLESLLSLIKKQAKKDKIKLSGFGVFSLKKTPKRIGRNPKTLVSYIIPEQFKLRFKASNNIKEKIN